MLMPVVAAPAASGLPEVPVPSLRRCSIALLVTMLWLAAFVGLVRLPLSFSEWWSYVGVWSLLICWVTLITVVALGYRALRRGTVTPPSW